MRLEGYSREEFEQKMDFSIRHCLVLSGQLRSEWYTTFMNAARSYGMEQQALQLARAICQQEDEPELWELPKDFEQGGTLPPLPVDCLPQKLWEYLKAVSDYVQVFPEMAVLPLLSVLSLCVQGKAIVKYPGNAHTEPLNLYTMTIAAPGERKSGCFKEFMRPVTEHQQQYNDSHALAVRNYKTQKAFLEKQRDKAMGGKSPDLKAAQDYDRQLMELKEIHELKLTVKDTTPEALAWEMAKQGERIAILDDEGSVFDVLTGLYSNGQVNINIFLEAYDGTPYTISRKTSEDITLYNPLLTMGLMVQPSHYAEAMSNRQFSGRGFIHRFMFAFPGAKAGHLNFSSPNIPLNIRTYYHDLVKKLLVTPYPQDKLPVIGHSHEAELLFEDYFEHLQREMQQGGRFENMKEWASKQFARALRVAAVLHLTEHTAAEPISGQTAMYATRLSIWCEEQACRALSGEVVDSDTVKNAKIILEKLKGLKQAEITRSELIASLRKMSANEIIEPLELLESMNFIKLVTTSGQKGRPKQTITVNPLIIQ